MLQAAGIDAIELSGGVIDPACHYIPVREGTPLTEDEEAYYRHAAKRFQERIGVPLILVGGIRSLEIAQELIGDLGVDYLALSRPLIREPHLIARWQAKDTRKSECGSCNGCFGPIQRGDGFYCEQRSASPDWRGTDAKIPDPLTGIGVVSATRCGRHQPTASRPKVSPVYGWPDSNWCVIPTIRAIIARIPERRQKPSGRRPAAAKRRDENMARNGVASTMEGSGKTRF